MKGRIPIPYLSSAILFCALLLPVTSQADVIWSLSLGHGLRLNTDQHRQYRYRPYRYKSPRHESYRTHELQERYWRRRVHVHSRYDDTCRSRYIPQRRSYYRGWRY